ncbi:MAG: 2-dehydropantoate 2-reductase [Clostridiales Family XIII bacterium]|jgi:2-dehydropantoate 2-reductase|nr:2-dehydropantoate 2-reductase [Clostridiales Family XIII bacterium]
MNKIKNICIVGLGAVGGFYASKLYRMDPACITAIVDRERFERSVGRPLVVNGESHAFQYCLPETQRDPADLILVAVKHHQLPQAIQNARNFVGPKTIVLSLLNGITSEEIIGRELGAEKMLYAVCLGILTEKTGNEVKVLAEGKLCFGEMKNETHSERVQAVKELLERAQIPYSIPEDMLYAQWQKFMINVGMNQISAVLRAKHGVFQEVPEVRELVESAMREVMALSQKTGVCLKEDETEKFFARLSGFSPEGKTSMLQDMEAGRKTEAEMLAGTVCELGGKYGVPTPVNNMLYKMIRAMETMAATER